MIRSLWIAKTGLEAQQLNVDVISNNLANVSTNGFKRQRPVFEDLLYQQLRQPGAQTSQQTQVPSGLQIGTGVRPSRHGAQLHQRQPAADTNPLDIAINGSGFFQILLPDGTTAYTRDGSFQLDSNGQMVTSSGYQLQPAITIPANTLTITIGDDGTVSVTQAGQRDADTGRDHSARELHQSGRPAGARREPVPGDGRFGSAAAGYAGHQRTRRAQSELRRDLQRERHRGAGEPDHRAACVRDQFARDRDVGSDVAEADAALNLLDLRNTETTENTENDPTDITEVGKGKQRFNVLRR